MAILLEIWEHNPGNDYPRCERNALSSLNTHHVATKMGRRKYELKERAEARARTLAYDRGGKTLELHLPDGRASLGPLVKARSARRAYASSDGRSTTISHMDNELFAACEAALPLSAPAPDPSGWQTISDPMASGLCHAERDLWVLCGPRQRVCPGKPR